ncbi:O-methyltransferase-domain-containing protein [Diaporthe sp. PMI_573]|nr:O-methyltransferase-domain-containing protein [Diaporthaceae sp. PMI_573]
MSSFELGNSPVGKYFCSMVELGVVRTFVEHNIFDAIPENGVTVSNLSKKLRASNDMMERFTDFLVAAKVLSSPSPGVVALPPATKVFQDPNASLFFSFLFEMTMGPTISWPVYFRMNGLIEPPRSNRTPAGLSVGQPDRAAYDLLEDMPQQRRTVNNAMALDGDIPVTGIYDFSWVAKYADDNRTLIVDVGGGKGQALRAILEENQNIPAALCVIQDRAIVVQDAIEQDHSGDILKPVKWVGQSFFEEQPIKGALLYYIRRVLNDWPDDEAVKILSGIRKACAGDSRVVISEYLRPERPNIFVSTVDLFSMNVGGKVRNERMFQALASKAGLSIKSVLKDEKTNSAVIEMVPI